MLARYRYVIAIVGIGLLLLPRLFSPVNGAYLQIKLGSLSVQPAEFSKLAIVVFLASYLRDTRQLMVIAGRRFLGLTIPPLKHFGPLLVVWGTAMVLLFYIKDIGSSVMFFGAFLAMIYIATNRVSFVLVGLVLFGVGAVLPGRPGAAHRTTASRPGRTRSTRSCSRRRAAATSSRRGCSPRPTAGSSARASAAPCSSCRAPSAARSRPSARCCPRPHTDFIYSVIVNELGLVGAGGLIIVYLLIVQRGFKIATLARDSFSKLLAAGLTCVFALQVFVIVGGVTKLIPLTGVTLPFVSYGGSSILANFVLLALLLLVSEKARHEA